MATPAEIIAQLDAAILAVLTSIANGTGISEWAEGPIRVKKATPDQLLAALRQMRADFVMETDTNRQAATVFNRGPR